MPLVALERPMALSQVTASPGPNSAGLSLSEGVELAYAWVQAVADSLGIRVLFIKGLTLQKLGLRRPRVSSDADVLVEPARFDELCQALAAAGWRQRGAGTVWASIPHHSRTYLTDHWPCDLDVHSGFPGFLADPEVTFDALWESRIDLEFAGRRCAVPNRAGAAMVLALHAIRSRADDPRHALELAYLVDVPWPAAERAEFRALAARTASTGPLREFFDTMGLGPLQNSTAIDPVRLREWRIRVTFQVTRGGAMYVRAIAIHAVPLHDRPRVLARLLWPSKADLEFKYPGLPDTVRARAAARLSWLGSVLTRLHSVLAHRPK